MSKMYKYKGKTYSDNVEDNADGDLFELYLELKDERKVNEIVYYYVPESAEAYEDIGAMLEAESELLGVEEIK